MCIVYGLGLGVHHMCVIIERENDRVTSKCEQSIDLRNELRLDELRPGLTFRFHGCGPFEFELKGSLYGLGGIFTDHVLI